MFNIWVVECEHKSLMGYVAEMLEDVKNDIKKHKRMELVTKLMSCDGCR